MICHVFVLFSCIFVVTCAPRITLREKMQCEEISELVLEEILGPAFNARYMSIEKPSFENVYKRTVPYSFDFSLDGEHEVSDETPAWTIINHAEATRNTFDANRYRRDLDYSPEWHCKSRLKWTDLGPDYFPRYLRSVECLAESCWFNMYKCRPRSFSVKILKRKQDRCVSDEPGTRTGVSGLPGELRELWVWEERAVTFCCDCSL